MVAPIVVSGSGTGIGRKLVEYLAEKNYDVYACTYKESEVEELEIIPHIQSIKVDVTSTSDIANLVNWIKEQKKGLFGLVNNAGIADLWPLLLSTEEDLHRTINVNLYGAFRMTNALIPFLKESKGHIVNLGSVAGTVAGVLYGAYSISKYAMEAYSEVLMREVRRFDIKVSLIKPGYFKSDIIKHTIPLYKSRGKDFSDSPYKIEIEELLGMFNNPDVVTGDIYPSPIKVVEGIYDALFGSSKDKYLIVNMQKESGVLFNWLFKSIAQMNQSQSKELRFTKETFHRMLDKHLDRHN